MLSAAINLNANLNLKTLFSCKEQNNLVLWWENSIIKLQNSGFSS